jgi:hypothetical protein
LVLAACFFAGLFFLHVYLLQQAESIISNFLDNKVVAASGGVYHTTFDKVEISYTSQQILITNLRLLPDSSLLTRQAANGKPLKTVYSLLIPELVIDDIGLRKAYLQNILDLNRLVIDGAEIRIDLNYDAPSPPVDSVLRKDIKRQLTPYFKSFEVGDITFSNFSVTINSLKNGEKSSVFTPASLLHISGLEVKTQLDPTDTDFIKVDDIKLQGSGVSGVLSDSTYLFFLEQIDLVKSDSSLYIQNLNVLPTADPTRLLDKKPELESVYEIRVPQVYGYGISYNALYNTRNLDLEELTILSPVLRLTNIQENQPLTKEPFKPRDLYEAIDRVLNRLTVGRLSIRYGESVILDRTADQTLAKFSTKIREASAFNFNLDSTSLARQDQLFFSDSLRVGLREYALRLGDQVHLLTADEIEINSNTNYIAGHNFRLVPDTTSRAADSVVAFYNGRVADLEFKGIDVTTLYNQNRLVIDSINLESPDFNFTRLVPKSIVWETEETKFRQSDIYTLISEYLYELQIGYLTLNNGVIQIDEEISDNNELFETKLRLARLWNFKIDSTSAYELKKLFNADDFELDIQDYRHHLPDAIHTIQANSLLVSTKQDKIVLTDLQITNERQISFPFLAAGSADLPLTLMNIQIPKLELLGVDVLEAYLKKKLLVDLVEIPNPVIQIGSKLLPKEPAEQKGIVSSRVLYTLMQPYLTQLAVKRLIISNAEVGTAFHAPNGSLTLNSALTDIEVNAFRFDSLSSQNAKRLFFAEDVKVKSQNLTIDPPDERYQLKVETLQTSTSQGEIMAKGVNLTYPDATISDQQLLLNNKKGLLTLTLSDLELKGVDFDRAYYDEVLSIDSILTEKPKVNFHFASTPARSKKNRRVRLEETNLYEAVRPFMSAIYINNVIVRKGEFTTNQTSSSGQIVDRLQLKNIMLAVEGFRLDSTASADTKRFFYSDDMRLHIDRYSFPLADGIHLLSARNLEVSTRNNLIILSDLRLQPKLTVDINQMSANKYTARVPEVILAGVNFDRIFDDEVFQAEKVDVINPTIDLRVYNNNTQEKLGKGNKMKVGKPDLSSILLTEANIIGAQLMYTTYSDGKATQTEFPNLSANFTDMRYDMLSDKESAPLYIENISFDFAGWKTLLPDSIHYLEPERVTFNATDSILAISNLKVYPRTDKPIASSKPQFTARIPQVLLEGVDLNQIQNDTLALNHIRFLMPELVVYTRKSANAVKENLQSAKVKTGNNSFSGLVNIDSISFQQAKVRLNTINEADTSGLELNSVYLKAKGIKVDSSLLKEDSRILFADNIQLGVKGYKFRTDDGFYDISVEEIGINTENTTLWLDSLRIIPALDRDSFANAKGYETDQFTFINNRLEFQNIDLRQLIYNNRLIMDRLFIDGFNLGVYRDKRQPYPVNHYPAMPQTSLRNSKLGLLIKESVLRNGYISYSERVKGSGRPGFIDLTDITITADTISNFKSILSQNYVTNLHASMNIMGAGHLEADFNIPFGDSLNRHNFSGHLTEMSLDKLNPILENTIFIKIQSGSADSIAFQVNADKDFAEGFMDFGYHNLEVALVSKKNGDPFGIFREVGSHLANLFLKNDNTGEIKDGKLVLRQGEIKYERDEERSIVNYWVKTLVDGFKSSIGL